MYNYAYLNLITRDFSLLLTAFLLSLAYTRKTTHSMVYGLA